MKTPKQLRFLSISFGGRDETVVEGEDRRQGTLLPEYLEDYVSEENPVRVIDVFVDELDLKRLGFEGVVPEVTGRPSYHPGLLLKIYVYGYINQVASTRKLEREARRERSQQAISLQKILQKCAHFAMNLTGWGSQVQAESWLNA